MFRVAGTTGGFLSKLMLERHRLMVTVSAAILAWEEEPPGARPLEIQRCRDVRPTICGGAIRGV